MFYDYLSPFAGGNSLILSDGTISKQLNIQQLQHNTEMELSSTTLHRPQEAKIDTILCLQSVCWPLGQDTLRKEIFVSVMISKDENDWKTYYLYHAAVTFWANPRLRFPITKYLQDSVLSVSYCNLWVGGRWWGGGMNWPGGSLLRTPAVEHL